MLNIIIFLIILLVGLIIAYFTGYKFGAFRKNREWENELPNHRRKAILKSRAILGGQFSEQLAPYLPDFNYLPTECRFVGKPIDFIVFKGMDEKDINEIIFIEVKSGNAKLSSSERKLRDVIKNKKIKWVEYRIPKDLTKNKSEDEREFC